MSCSSKIIGLLAAYPGRQFRMIQIVRQVAGGEPKSPQHWENVRKRAARALRQLDEHGMLDIEPALTGSGGYSLYSWKISPETLANRDGKRDNNSKANSAY